MADKKKEPRVAVETESGHTVWLPQSQVAAFRAGQERLKQGQRPKEAERKASELLSKLKEL